MATTENAASNRISEPATANETNEPAGTQSTGGLCHATHETSDKHDVACDPVFPFDVLALRGPSETTTSHTEGHQSWWFLLSDRKQQTAMPLALTDRPYVA